MTTNAIGAGVEVINHGTIVLLTPISEEARLWCEEHIGHATRWGQSSYVIEPRYVGPIIEGMREEGVIS